MPPKFLVALAFIAALSSTASAAPTLTCYVNDGYAISAVPEVDEANEVFSIQRKASPDQVLPCPIDPAAADFVVGEGGFGYSYTDLLADHLVLDVSTGPIGNIVVVDLRSGETVLDISGVYAYAGDDGIHYWARGDEGTPETCERYEEFTAMGLSTGMLAEMVLYLETLQSATTGLTDCEPIS